MRASQDQRSQPGPPPQDRNRSLAILIHGDAAFPGQGSSPRRSTSPDSQATPPAAPSTSSSTIRLAFTTDTRDSRSTLYASDLAKGFEIPVVHVNADDPDSVPLGGAPGDGVPPAIRQGLPDRPRRLPPLGTQRGRRADLHPAANVRHRRLSTPPCASVCRPLAAEGIVSRGRSGDDAASPASTAGCDPQAGDRRRRRERASGGERAPRRRPAADTGVSARRICGPTISAIHTLPERLTLSPKLRRQWERRAAILARARRGREDRLGPRRNARLRHDPLRRHADPAHRPRHRARHLQAAPPRPPRCRNGRALTPLQTLPAARRPSRSTTARSRSRRRSASSMATACTRRRRWCSGRRNSATSRTAPRS